ncbi:hypothetical protein SUGI_0702070 [Cryptomeria japonica]|nr:hypothetical protein SUGI_0702070 [Cryptomeria japonica]
MALRTVQREMRVNYEEDALSQRYEHGQYLVDRQDVEFIDFDINYLHNSFYPVEGLQNFREYLNFYREYSYSSQAQTNLGFVNNIDNGEFIDNIFNYEDDYFEYSFEYLGLVNTEMEDNEHMEGGVIGDEEAAEILGSTSEEINCDGEDVCAICLDPMQKCFGDLKELPCKHIYHYNCILKSTKIKNRCPMCREKYDCRERKSN